ncbi:hypothetical protein [Cupriavidus numazuensis]|uniref:Uncharacterized protein n=1 Tax=Cupriavidus numazuensis TaxID=221992 RepID=A0ABN7PVN6_9BURK|nr:hypothetical protein [Cupriavidus numazuensis]CAG2129328.1 hypothetical protein LMG26411_00156 [Cupriavidus numazuensis]
MKSDRQNRRPSPDSIAARIPEEQGRQLASTSRSRKVFPGTRRPHVDDIAVDQLATAMKAKLATCRTLGRRGWDNPLECSVERLARLMAHAICKGDPVDVANYAAMLHARRADYLVVSKHATRGFLQGSREDQSKRINELDAALSQTIDERDRYHAAADKLAEAIAAYFHVDIGEHSSASCPWEGALAAIESAPAPQPRGIDDASPREWDLASRNARLTAEHTRLTGALNRIAHMLNHNSQPVDMHREELRAIARTALQPTTTREKHHG